jgi:toxin ParE1/3/4
MDYRVSLTAAARRDIREIVRFISLDSPQRGAQFGGRLIACAGSLSQFPRRGRIVPEFERPTIREIIFHSYRVIYHLDDLSGNVTVLRFWHAARGTPKVEL